jgi:hypothetical protein
MTCRTNPANSPTRPGHAAAANSPKSEDSKSQLRTILRQMHFSIFTFHFSPLTSHLSLFTFHFFTLHSSLLHSSLFTLHFFTSSLLHLLTVFRSLFTVHCPLSTDHCSLLNVIQITVRANSPPFGV